MLIGGADHRPSDRPLCAASWTWARVDGAVGSQIVARAGSDPLAGDGEFVDCGSVARRGVSVVESADVGQDNDPAVLAWLDGAQPAA